MTLRDSFGHDVQPMDIKTVPLNHKMVMALLQGKDVVMLSYDVGQIVLKSPFREVLVTREELHELRMMAAQSGYMPNHNKECEDPSRYVAEFQQQGDRYIDIGEENGTT